MSYYGNVLVIVVETQGYHSRCGGTFSDESLKALRW